MNERIRELALKAGLLNSTVVVTPQRYYIDSYADVEELEEFARLIVKDCAGIYEAIDNGNDVEGTDVYTVALSSRYFGVSG